MESRSRLTMGLVTRLTLIAHRLAREGGSGRETRRPCGLFVTCGREFVCQTSLERRLPCRDYRAGLRDGGA